MTATTATTAVKSIGRRMENILPISKSNKTDFVDNNNDDDDGCNWISSNNNNNKQQPSPDKTASLDDDCLECSYDDLHEGEDSQPNNNNKKKTLAHKLLLRGSVRKINMNTTNNDDIIAAAALANADKLAQQQQQQQLTLPTPSSGSSGMEFGPRINKILCSNSSSGTTMSDLSASLSPTLSSESWIAGLNQQQRQQQQQKMMMMMQQEEECFGGGGCNLYVHRTRSRSVDDTGTTFTASRYHHREQRHCDSMTTTGGGGGGEGILIKAMKSCAVFRDFDAFLGNGGRGGDDYDIIPPPPPPRNDNGGAVYPRPAIWGLPPDDVDNTFDEESYISAGGGGGGFTHTPFSIAQCNITKDDGELMMKTDEDDEEEEYDNVELILDESKMPVSAPPPRKNNRRSKSSPQRGSKKISMIKKSSNPMRMLLGGRNNNYIIPTNIDSPPPPVTIVQQEDKKNMSVGTTTTRDLVVDQIDKSTMAPSPSPTSALEIAAVLQDEKTTINIEEESSIQLKETRSRQVGRQRRHSQKKDEEDKNKPRAAIASTPPLVSTDSDPTIILHDVATPDRQLRETKTPTTNDEQVLDKLARRSYLPEVCTPPVLQQDLLNKTLEEEFEIDDLMISSTNTGGQAMKDKKTLKSAIMLRSMKKGMNNFKLAAPKTKATTTNTTTAPVISDKDIRNARHWNAVYDRSTKKYYYYHKLTREVRWDKPVGFDEANNNNNNNTSSTKKRSGLVGIVGKKALGSNKQGDDTGNPDQVKYWRATIDKSTNEVYYYNSKTKEVSWTMPTCLNEKDGKTSHDEKAKEEEEVKLAERSVSTVQMINNIIGKNIVKSAEKKNPIEENNTVSVGTTEGISNQLIPAPAVEVVANNSNTTYDDVRHWREATDATTGKTYYFHNMTKMVTWVKPSEFKDSHQDGTVAAVGGPTVDVPAPTKQHTYLADDLSEEAEDDVEKMANVLLPNEQNNESNDVPFDEDEAPFDEQPQKQGSRLKTSSIKQVVTVTPSQFEDEDGEQHDTFDQFSPMPNSGRSNNKSISDQLSRQRTYVSHATSTKSDSTKKVTNTGHIINPSSPGRNDTAYNRNVSGAATFDSSSSINSSNIVSEITAIIGSKKMTNNRGGGHKEEENDIPHIPNTSSRAVAGQTAKTSSKGTSAAAVSGGGSNRKYTSKRAENLGDSSSADDKDEDDELWSEDDDSVSALSGIGNDSIIFSTNTKKKTTTMKKRTSGNCKKKTSDQSELPSSSDSFNKWTQEELDLFISKNDWGSVAEYINEIRASKQDVFNRNMSSSSRNKKQSTIREVEDRKKNVISPAEEESIWQSLSSDDEK